MAARIQKNKPKATWKTKWPRNGDLKAWFRAMIEKCDAIVDHGAATDKAHLPIEHLAKMGCVKEALRHVNRFLQRLPQHDVLAKVRMAELGAKICLKGDDLTGLEEFLAIAESTEPFNTRKCDKGFSLNSVREFRAEHGLLEPADAVDEERRVTARFERAARQFKQALGNGERESAITAVTEMQNTAHMAGKDWLRRSHLQRVLVSYAELNDTEALKQCVRRLKTADCREVLDARTLVRLGMTNEAIARAQEDIAKELTSPDERSEHSLPINVDCTIAETSR